MAERIQGLVNRDLRTVKRSALDDKAARVGLKAPKPTRAISSLAT